MSKLSKKGKIIVAIVMLVILILFVVGIFVLPIYGTIEAVILFIGGIFFGWLLKSANIIKKVPNEN